MNPIKLFEEEFKKWNESPYAISVNNGSSALFAALKATGVPKGSHIITSPFTFPATANMIIAAGGKPLFCDIDPETLLLDPESVAQVVDDCHAILLPQLFGRIADMPAFGKFDVPLIEDASQGLGAEWGGIKAGNFGNVGTYSFYATKNLWTYEGGMIVTNDADIAKRIRMLRNHGMHEGRMMMLGYNLKMPWICAFQGWQMLLMHKTAILSELGTQGLEKHRDIYGTLVYQHIWYDHNPKAWSKMDCPHAENAARRLRG